MLSNTFFLSAAAMLALLNIIKADSLEFSLLTVRSATVLQFSGVMLDTDNATDGYYPVAAGGTSYDKYVVDDEGRLVANSSYYWGLIPDTDGQYGATTDSANAITGFSILDGYLQSSKGYAFIAVPDETAWYLYSENALGDNSNTTDNLGVALLCSTTEGLSYSFEPSSSSNSTTTTTTSSSETTTLAPYENTTTTYSSAPYENTTTTYSSAPYENTTTTYSSDTSDITTTASIETSGMTTAPETATETATTSSSSSSATNTVTSENIAASFDRGSLSLIVMGLAGLFL
ncbi:hypothetical protein ACO0SA_002281 [Hanseniaspora valbyensis]